MGVRTTAIKVGDKVMITMPTSEKIPGEVTHVGFAQHLEKGDINAYRIRTGPKNEVIALDEHIDLIKLESLK